jgi:hypothetical protein
MAINWTEIEGYNENMSADEKLALLEAHEPKAPSPAPPAPPADPKPEPDPEPKPEGKTVPKSMLDKALSEVASMKKQLRAKMTDDEAAAADAAKAQEEMKLELDSLRRDKTLNAYKASYLAQGYDEALASETAEAMADGDMDAVFANMKKHSTSLEKSLRAQILKETPVPPAGSNPDSPKTTEEEIRQQLYGQKG